jgi:hypothetical protein
MTATSYVYLTGDSQPFLIALPCSEVLDRMAASDFAPGQGFVQLPSIAGEEDDPKVTQAHIKAARVTAVTVPLHGEQEADIAMAIVDAKRAHPDWFANNGPTR